MKRLLIILIIFVVFGILVGRGITYFSTHGSIVAVPNATKPQVKNLSTPTPTSIPSAGIPVTLNIPSLEVNAEIEQVGLDAQKRMDVPKGNYNVGWYMYGTRPGEVGSAVMDGHVDTPTGAPSVFADLKDIEPGAEISVTDDKGTVHTYYETSTVTYALADVPNKTIFGKTDKKNLVLITCGGTWDKASRNYSHRIVTYATAK